MTDCIDTAAEREKLEELTETDRKKILVEHVEFDWAKVAGVSLRDAAKYLTSLAGDLPDDAAIEEHWTGYEDMEVRVTSYRRETDEEYRFRKEREERQREYDEKLRIKEYEKAKRREKYLRLKREFG